LIFGNGARSPIVLGLVPLTSLNRSFLWMTELSHSQNVAVPLSTRTNRRLKRSSEAVVRPRGNMPKKSAPVARTLRKGKRPGKDLRPLFIMQELVSMSACENSESHGAAPLPMGQRGVAVKVDLSHCFSTRQTCAQEGNLWKGSPAWRPRVLKSALRLRPRRALSSASGQRRHTGSSSVAGKEKNSLDSGRTETCFTENHLTERQEMLKKH
jgi:hypothetical protein